MAKRMLDLLLAAVGLVVLAPVLLAAMAWVRIDSPGPVFFRQERVGRHGRVFRIHKLRTMRVDAGAQGPTITAHADARITRAGHWLRRYRIDELPQLIDVLLGDMSLVGPRPEVPRFVALYPESPTRRRSSSSTRASFSPAALTQSAPTLWPSCRAS
jgi:lipopolysaccharide/colanic/teichoic acid biosynthesis glycosyltransferase